jgi:multiple sugar transport system permease protein
MTAHILANGDPPHFAVPQQPARRSRLWPAAGHAFVAPAVVLMVLLVLAPLVSVILFSVTDYTLAATSLRFVALDNYRAMLADDVVMRSIRNTAVYVGIVVSLSVGLGLLVALLVNRRRRSRRVYEIVFFLPVTSTLVAMAVVWQYLLHGRIGPLNAIVSMLGFDRIDFLTDPHVALYALAGIGVWQGMGFAMVLFLAGLTAIPQDIYDAAALDGADRGFDRFWRITWPLLAPTTLFVAVTTTITAFQVFDTVAVLTRGGPMGSTDTLLYTIYQEGFVYFETGYASALTVVFLAFIVGFSLLQIRVAERRIHYGG